MRLALFQPDIPQNLGAAVRLAACLGVSLDVIEPCGFPLGDAAIRRAAMDYTALADVSRHASWSDFRANTETCRRLVLFTTQAATPLHAFEFRADDILLFGREFWTRLLNFDALIETGMISPGDVHLFRYVETAEHAFFRSLGHAPHAAAASGAGHHGWPRLETSCRYHRPARFEQTLEIGLRLLELRTTSLRYGFWIFGVDPAPTSTALAATSAPPARSLLADGTFAIIHVALHPPSPALQKTPIPAALRARHLKQAQIAWKRLRSTPGFW